jgi:uncharacterized membrane protein
MRHLKVRRYLAAGLLVWVPLLVTFLALRFLINLMDQSLLLVPAVFRPENVFGFRIPGIGVILTFALLFATGIVAANYVGKQVIDAWERVLAQIPLVSWVYSGVKQVAQTVLSPNTKAFRKVLLIEYPRKGIWTIAFQTSGPLDEIQARTEKDVIGVFVPTTPNPTSGFIMLVPKEDVVELDMSVDEAMRMVISLGVLVPEWRRQELVSRSA